MEQYKIGNATVRIHGIPDREKIEAATVIFLKEAQQQRKKARSNQFGNRTSAGTIHKEGK